MSAPSKEEIARIVGVARDEAPLLHLESYNLVSAVIVSLAGESESRHVENKACDDTIVMLSRENDRLLTDLREEVETNVELRAKLDSVRDENEQLRAERAECLALLGKVEASRVVLHSPLGSVSREDVSAMVAKLRGQS